MDTQSFRKSDRERDRKIGGQTDGHRPTQIDGWKDTLKDID